MEGTHTGMGKRVRPLDGLRGLAILLVLIYNSTVGFLPDHVPAPLIHCSWFGVTVFFALSGYLIGSILLDHRESPNLLGVFFVRRACRILPLYLLLLLPLLLLPVVLDHPRLGTTARHAMEGGSGFLTHLFFFQNWHMAWTGEFGPRWIGTTWSLCVEEQFYLLAAFGLRFIPPRHLRWLLLGAVVIAPAIRVVLAFALPDYHAGVAAYVLLPCRWDALALGVLFAAAPRLGWIDIQRWLAVVAHPRFAIAATAVTVLSLSYFSSPTSPFVSTIGHTLAAATAASWLGLALRGGRTSRWLGAKLLCQLGTVSYGVYLLHEPILGFGMRVVRGSRIIDSPAAVVSTFGLLAVTIAAATLSWHWLEKPIVRVGQRFCYVPRSRISPDTTRPASAFP